MSTPRESEHGSINSPSLLSSLQSAEGQSKTSFSVFSSSSSWMLVETNCSSVTVPEVPSAITSQKEQNVLLTPHHLPPHVSSTTQQYVLSEERAVSPEWSVLSVERPRSMPLQDFYDVFVSEGGFYNTLSGIITDVSSGDGDDSGDGDCEELCDVSDEDNVSTCACTTSQRCVRRNSVLQQWLASLRGKRSAFVRTDTKRSSDLLFAPYISRGGRRLSLSTALLQPMRIPSLKKRIPSESGDELSPQSSFAAAPTHKHSFTDWNNSCVNIVKWDNNNKNVIIINNDNSGCYCFHYHNDSADNLYCTDEDEDDESDFSVEDSDKISCQECDVSRALPFIISFFCSFLGHALLSSAYEYRRVEKRQRCFLFTNDNDIDSKANVKRCGWSSVGRWFVCNMESLMLCAIHGIIVFVL